MKKVKITKGWFRAAGNVYKWKNKHHIFGVGIDMQVLRSNDTIHLEVENDLYWLNCKQAIAFINQYHSLKVVGQGKRLGVISKSILVPLSVEPIEGEPKQKAPETGMMF